MIKQIFVAVICCLAVMQCAICAAAGSPLTNKLGVGAYGVASFQRLKNFDTGFGGGGYVKYMPTDNLGFEASFDAQGWDFKSGTISGASGALNKTITVMPLSLTAMYIYPMYEGKFYPYAGGGVDYLFIDGKVTGTLTPGGNSSIKFNNKLGEHISAGFDYALNQSKSWVFNFDMKYTWCTPSVKTSTTTPGTTLTVGNHKFDNFATRFGLAYYF